MRTSALSSDLLDRSLTNGNSVECGSRDLVPVPLLLHLIRVHRLPGPPLSKETEITLFLQHNVTVGIGIEEAWSARNTRFDVGWVCFPFPF